MKIEYAIHSVNSNPMYLDFWPIVAKLWKLKFNITPVLVYVGNTQPKLNQEYGTVVYLEKLPAIPEALQAQWARFWYTQQLPDSTCIISDMDMLPLSASYFVEQLAAFPENDYAHLNACIPTYGALPACYHVAKGEIFKKMLKLDSDWEQSLTKLWNFNSSLPLNFKYHNNGNPWFADERYSTFYVMDTEHGVRKHLLQRKGGHDALRIDRAYWKYHHNLLKLDYYIDCHLPRPYKNHSDEIDRVVQTTLTASNETPGPYKTIIEKMRSALLNKVRLLNNK